MITHEHQHGNEQHHGNREPGQLRIHVRRRQRCVIANRTLRCRDVNAIDHHEAENRQQCGDRQHDRVGVRSGKPDGDVHSESEGSHYGDRDPQPRRSALAGCPTDLQHAQHTDEPREDEQEKLNSATRGLPEGRNTHVVAPGQPAGGKIALQAVARTASSVTMRWASAWLAAGIPLLTSS